MKTNFQQWGFFITILTMGQGEVCSLENIILFDISRNEKKNDLTFSLNYPTFALMWPDVYKVQKCYVTWEEMLSQERRCLVVCDKILDHIANKC